MSNTNSPVADISSPDTSASPPAFERTYSSYMPSDAMPSVLPDYDEYAFMQYIDQSNSQTQPTIKSRIDLIRQPVCTFIDCVQNIAPNSNITIIFYDDKVEVCKPLRDDGTTDFESLKRMIKNKYARGSTDFIKMTAAVKAELALLDPSVETYTFVLTDGHHNVGGNVSELTNDPSVNGLFNLTLGIGTTTSVNNSLLKYLSNATDDNGAHHVSCEEDHIIKVISGGCFEGLISMNMRKVVFEAVFAKDQSTYVSGTASTVDMTQAKIDEYMRSAPSTDDQCMKVPCTNIVKDIFCVGPSDYNISEDLAVMKQKFGDKKINFTVCIDISSSMSESVTKPYQVYGDIPSTVEDTPKRQRTNSDDAEVEDKPYTKVIFKEIGNFTNGINIVLRGKLLNLKVTYLQDGTEMRSQHVYRHPDVVTCCSMDETTHFEQALSQFIHIFQELENIDQIPKRRRNFAEIREKIAKLHEDNKDFLEQIDHSQVPEWFVQQATAIWRSVSDRYHASLTRGDQFLEMNHNDVTPSAQALEITRIVSCATSTPSDPCYESGICKICLTETIDTVLDKCKHAVVCKKCIKSSIDSGHGADFTCPICRTINDKYIALTYTGKPACQKCGGIVKYIGTVCKHPICCDRNSCKRHLVDLDKTNLF